MLLVFSRLRRRFLITAGQGCRGFFMRGPRRRFPGDAAIIAMAQKRDTRRGASGGAELSVRAADSRRRLLASRCREAAVRSRGG